MSFPVSFLRASDGTPLTKTYHLQDQTLHKNNYPHILEFSSTTFQVTTLEDFYGLIKDHAVEHSCLLKGQLLKELDNESRAGSTDNQQPTQWICLDIDGLPGIDSEEELIAHIPCLQDVSYISQASASMGVEPEKGLSKHLFFILNAQLNPQLLKNWLIHLNLSVPILRDRIKLTRSNVALRWPLDISTCQNDKLIYIAPPILGPGIKDQYKKNRLQLITKGKPTLKIELADISLERNDHEKLAITNKLRKAIGMPAKRKEVYKQFGEVEVLKNPGKAQVTGEKSERGFTYLNINGGNSWAYYYPNNNPEILYNFKGEPNYLTKEFLPDYYRGIAKSSTETGTGIYWLAFRDHQTDKYYIGYYDYENASLQITRTDSKDKVKDFLKEHGQPVGDFIPTWRYEIDFQSDIEFDPENKFINRYIRSDYMKNANKECHTVPPLIDKLLTHTFGTLKEHFLNWAAVILQYRTKTDMAWVLTGTPGSGKGVIATRLLVPLIGPDYAFVLNTLSSFENVFNKYLNMSLLTFVDESSISDTTKHVRVADRIKSFITEDRISIREMRTDEFMVKNHNNFIFASNQFDPMYIDIGDRRFTVAQRQETKLFDVLTKQEIEEGLKAELYDFAGYLLNRQADRMAASTVVHTEERGKLQQLAVDSGIAAANAINSGDLQFFINNIPEYEDAVRISTVLNMLDPPLYVDILDKFVQSEGTPCKISRRDLQILFFHTAGIKHDNPGQFTKHMSHKGLFIKQIRHEGMNTQGIDNVNWKITPEIKKEWKRLYKTKPPRLHLINE